MNIAASIEHTLLSPEATEADIERLCAEAVQCGFLAVCVPPVHVARAATALRGESPFVVTVAGFPTGASLGAVKAREAALAVETGAAEVDMVIRRDAVRSGNAALAGADIAEVVRAMAGKPLKVIIESGTLSDEQIRVSCSVLEAAGASFAKTSTGFFGCGATVHAVELMRRCLGPGVGVKASGGIKTGEQARELLRAGADRIGCSASLRIIGKEPQ